MHDFPPAVWLIRIDVSMLSSTTTTEDRTLRKLDFGAGVYSRVEHLYPSFRNAQQLALDERNLDLPRNVLLKIALTVTVTIEIMILRSPS